MAAPGAVSPISLDWFKSAPLKLVLPKSIAQVEDFFAASTPHAKTIVLLQDAHTNDSGQFNLSKALDLILRDQNIRYVFTEASVGDSSLSFLRPLSSSHKRTLAAESFVHKGYLHGAEHLDLTSERDFVLWGVEDPKLYEQSLEAYRKITSKRPDFAAYLNEIETTINLLKPRILNPSLLSLSEKSIQYRTEQIGLTEYFDFLSQKAKEHSVSLQRYPHFRRWQSLKAKERAIDFVKANREQTEALNNLPESQRKELLSYGQKAFKVGSLERSEPFGYFALLEEKIGPKEKFPELTRYFGYLKASRRLSPKDLLKEQKAIEAKLGSALSVTLDEQKLMQAQASLYALKDLLDLKLIPEEYEDLKRNPAAWDITRLTGFLNKKIMDLKKYYPHAIFIKDGYEDIVRECRRFYALTQERDIHFIEEALKKMDAEGEDKAVLITGGYHSSNLKALLKARGISFVTVTPQVFHPTDLGRYERILLSQNFSEPDAGIRIAQADAVRRASLMTLYARPLGGAWVGELLSSLGVDPAVLNERSRQAVPAIAPGARIAAETGSGPLDSMIEKWGRIKERFSAEVERDENLRALLPQIMGAYAPAHVSSDQVPVERWESEIRAIYGLIQSHRSVAGAQTLSYKVFTPQIKVGEEYRPVPLTEVIVIGEDRVGIENQTTRVFLEYGINIETNYGAKIMVNGKEIFLSVYEITKAKKALTDADAAQLENDLRLSSEQVLTSESGEITVHGHLYPEDQFVKGQIALMPQLSSVPLVVAHNIIPRSLRRPTDDPAILEKRHTLIHEDYERSESILKQTRADAFAALSHDDALRDSVMRLIELYYDKTVKAMSAYHSQGDYYYPSVLSVFMDLIYRDQVIYERTKGAGENHIDPASDYLWKTILPRLEKHFAVEDPSAEIERLHEMLESVLADIGENETPEMQSIGLMIRYDLLAKIEAFINQEHSSAIRAIYRAGVEHFSVLKQTPEEALVPATSSLVEAQRILATVTRRLRQSPTLPDIVGTDTTDGTFVLFAPGGVDASQVVNLANQYPDRIRAIVTDTGTGTSHWIVKAKQNGIPVFLISPDSRAFKIADRGFVGKEVFLTRSDGRLIINPSATTLESYSDEMHVMNNFHKNAQIKSGEPAVTQTRRRIGVMANADSPDEAHQAALNGAEGVGLMRTEYLLDANNRALVAYLKDPSPANREELVEAFAAIFGSMLSEAGSEIVTVRAPDIQRQSDKPNILPNPTGIYGPDYYQTPMGKVILEIWLEGAFTANARSETGTLQVLFPMFRPLDHQLRHIGKILPPNLTGDKKDAWIRDAWNLTADQSQSLVEQAAQDAEFAIREFKTVRGRMGRRQTDRGAVERVLKTRLGIMAENQESAAILPQILPYIDFVDIGANDLTVSVYRELNLSRDDSDDAVYMDTLQPEVLEAIRGIAQSINEHNKIRRQKTKRETVPLLIAGDIASHMGFSIFTAQSLPADLEVHLSVPPAQVAPIKHFIRGIGDSDLLSFEAFGESAEQLNREMNERVRGVIEKQSMRGARVAFYEEGENLLEALKRANEPSFASKWQADISRDIDVKNSLSHDEKLAFMKKRWADPIEALYRQSAERDGEMEVRSERALLLEQYLIHGIGLQTELSTGIRREIALSLLKEFLTDRDPRIYEPALKKTILYIGSWIAHTPEGSDFQADLPTTHPIHELTGEILETASEPGFDRAMRNIYERVFVEKVNPRATTLKLENYLECFVLGAWWVEERIAGSKPELAQSLSEIRTKHSAGARAAEHPQIIRIKSYVNEAIGILAPSDPLPAQADILFIPGNDQIKLFEEAAFIHQRVKYVLVSGGVGRLTPSLVQNVKASAYAKSFAEDLDTLTEAEIIAQILVANGVPKEKILIEKRAKVTTQNFEYGKAMLDDLGISYRSVIYMQKALQERRTEGAFKLVMPKTRGYRYVPRSLIPDVQNLSEEELLETLRFIREEFLKLRTYPALGYIARIRLPARMKSLENDLRWAQLVLNMKLRGEGGLHTVTGGKGHAGLDFETRLAIAKELVRQGMVLGTDEIELMRRIRKDFPLTSVVYFMQDSLENGLEAAREGSDALFASSGVEPRKFKRIKREFPHVQIFSEMTLDESQLEDTATIVKEHLNGFDGLVIKPYQRGGSHSFLSGPHWSHIANSHPLKTLVLAGGVFEPYAREVAKLPLNMVPAYGINAQTPEEAAAQAARYQAAFRQGFEPRIHGARIGGESPELHSDIKRLNELRAEMNAASKAFRIKFTAVWMRQFLSLLAVTALPFVGIVYGAYSFWTGSSWLRLISEAVTVLFISAGAIWLRAKTGYLELNNDQTRTLVNIHEEVYRLITGGQDKPESESDALEKVFGLLDERMSGSQSQAVKDYYSIDRVVLRQRLKEYQKIKADILADELLMPESVLDIHAVWIQFMAFLFDAALFLKGSTSAQDAAHRLRRDLIAYYDALDEFVAVHGDDSNSHNSAWIKRSIGVDLLLLNDLISQTEGSVSVEDFAAEMENAKSLELLEKLGLVQVDRSKEKHFVQFTKDLMRLPASVMEQIASLPEMQKDSLTEEELDQTATPGTVAWKIRKLIAEWKLEELAKVPYATPEFKGLSLEQYPEVKSRVEEAVRLLRSAAVEVLDESDEARLEEEAIERGEAIRYVNGGIIFLTHPQDTKRAVLPTWVATGTPEDAGIFNHHVMQDEIMDLAKAQVAGTHSGETAYMIPYLIDQPGSPMARFGVQVTKHRHVALTYMKLNRIGRAALQAFDKAQSHDFTLTIAGNQNLDDVRRFQESNVWEDRFFVAFPESGLVISANSLYGGNVIGSKKFDALRIGTWLYEKFTKNKRVEHAATWLLQVITPIPNSPFEEGDSIGFSLWAPAGSGKTTASTTTFPQKLKEFLRNLIFSDDITDYELTPKGELMGSGAENGAFGILRGNNEQTGPVAMHAINSGKAIFFNPAVKLRKVGDNRFEAVDIWWEGKTPQAPWEQVDQEPDGDHPIGQAAWYNWRKERMRDIPSDKRNKVDWAEENSRYAVQLKEFSTWIGNVPKEELPSKVTEHLQVPVRVFFSAARREHMPLIVFLHDQAAGLVNAGLNLKAETTAAETGKTGVVGHDPRANRPFMSTTELSSTNHQLDMFSRTSLPIYGVSLNVFRKLGPDGIRIFEKDFKELMWLQLWVWKMVKRLDAGQSVDDIAMETAIGFVPKADQLDLDYLASLGVSRELVEKALSVDLDKQLDEVNEEDAWREKNGLTLEKGLSPSVVQAQELKRKRIEDALATKASGARVAAVESTRKLNAYDDDAMHRLWASQTNPLPDLRAEFTHFVKGFVRKVGYADIRNVNVQSTQLEATPHWKSGVTRIQFDKGSKVFYGYGPNGTLDLRAEAPDERQAQILLKDLNDSFESYFEIHRAFETIIQAAKAVWYQIPEPLLRQYTEFLRDVLLGDRERAKGILSIAVEASKDRGDPTRLVSGARMASDSLKIFSSFLFHHPIVSGWMTAFVLLLVVKLEIMPNFIRKFSAVAMAVLITAINGWYTFEAIRLGGDESWFINLVGGGVLFAILEYVLIRSALRIMGEQTVDDIFSTSDGFGTVRGTAETGSTSILKSYGITPETLATIQDRMVAQSQLTRAVRNKDLTGLAALLVNPDVDVRWAAEFELLRLLSKDSGIDLNQYGVSLDFLMTPDTRPTLVTVDDREALGKRYEPLYRDVLQYCGLQIKTHPDSDSSKPLIELLGAIATVRMDHSIYVRQDAVRILRSAGTPESLKFVEQALQDPDMLSREVRFEEGASESDVKRAVVEAMTWLIGEERVRAEYPDIDDTLNFVFENNPGLISFLRAYPLRLHTLENASGFQSFTLGRFRKYWFRVYGLITFLGSYGRWIEQRRKVVIDDRKSPIDMGLAVEVYKNRIIAASVVHHEYLHYQGIDGEAQVHLMQANFIRRLIMNEARSLMPELRDKFEAGLAMALHSLGLTHMISLIADALDDRYLSMLNQMVDRIYGPDDATEAKINAEIADVIKEIRRLIELNNKKLAADQISDPEITLYEPLSNDQIAVLSDSILRMRAIKNQLSPQQFQVILAENRELMTLWNEYVSNGGTKTLASFGRIMDGLQRLGESSASPDQRQGARMAWTLDPQSREFQWQKIKRELHTALRFVLTPDGYALLKTIIDRKPLPHPIPHAATEDLTKAFNGKTYMGILKIVRNFSSLALNKIMSFYDSWKETEVKNYAGMVGHPYITQGESVVWGSMEEFIGRHHTLMDDYERAYASRSEPRSEDRWKYLHRIRLELAQKIVAYNRLYPFAHVRLDSDEDQIVREVLQRIAGRHSGSPTLQVSSGELRNLAAMVRIVAIQDQNKLFDPLNGTSPDQLFDLLHIFVRIHGIQLPDRLVYSPEKLDQTVDHEDFKRAIMYVREWEEFIRNPAHKIPNHKRRLSIDLLRNIRDSLSPYHTLNEVDRILDIIAEAAESESLTQVPLKILYGRRIIFDEEVSVEKKPMWQSKSIFEPVLLWEGKDVSSIIRDRFKGTRSNFKRRHFVTMTTEGNRRIIRIERTTAKVSGARVASIDDLIEGLTKSFEYRSGVGGAWFYSRRGKMFVGEHWSDSHHPKAVRDYASLLRRKDEALFDKEHMKFTPSDYARRIIEGLDQDPGQADSERLARVVSAVWDTKKIQLKHREKIDFHADVIQVLRHFLIVNPDLADETRLKILLKVIARELIAPLPPNARTHDYDTDAEAKNAYARHLLDHFDDVYFSEDILNYVFDQTDWSMELLVSILERNPDLYDTDAFDRFFEEILKFKDGLLYSLVSVLNARNLDDRRFKLILQNPNPHYYGGTFVIKRVFEIDPALATQENLELATKSKDRNTPEVVAAFFNANDALATTDNLEKLGYMTRVRNGELDYQVQGLLDLVEASEAGTLSTHGSGDARRSFVAEEPEGVGTDRIVKSTEPGLVGRAFYSATRALRVWAGRGRWIKLARWLDRVHEPYRDLERMKSLVLDVRDRGAVLEQMRQESPATRDQMIAISFKYFADKLLSYQESALQAVRTSESFGSQRDKAKLIHQLKKYFRERESKLKQIFLSLIENADDTLALTPSNVDLYFIQAGHELNEFFLNLITMVQADVDYARLQNLNGQGVTAETVDMSPDGLEQTLHSQKISQELDEILKAAHKVQRDSVVSSRQVRGSAVKNTLGARMALTAEEALLTRWVTAADLNDDLLARYGYSVQSREAQTDGGIWVSINGNVYKSVHTTADRTVQFVVNRLKELEAAEISTQNLLVRSSGNQIIIENAGNDWEDVVQSMVKKAVEYAKENGQNEVKYRIGKNQPMFYGLAKNESTDRQVWRLTSTLESQIREAGVQNLNLFVHKNGILAKLKTTGARMTAIGNLLDKIMRYAFHEHATLNDILQYRPSTLENDPWRAYRNILEKYGDPHARYLANRVRRKLKNGNELDAPQFHEFKSLVDASLEQMRKQGINALQRTVTRDNVNYQIDAKQFFDDLNELSKLLEQGKVSFPEAAPTNLQDGSTGGARMTSGYHGEGSAQDIITIIRELLRVTRLKPFQAIHFEDMLFYLSENLLEILTGAQKISEQSRWVNAIVLDWVTSLRKYAKESPDNAKKNHIVSDNMLGIEPGIYRIGTTEIQNPADNRMLRAIDVQWLTGEEPAAPKEEPGSTGNPGARIATTEDVIDQIIKAAGPQLWGKSKLFIMINLDGGRYDLYPDSMEDLIGKLRELLNIQGPAYVLWYLSKNELRIDDLPLTETSDVEARIIQVRLKTTHIIEAKDRPFADKSLYENIKAVREALVEIIASEKFKSIQKGLQTFQGRMRDLSIIASHQPTIAQFGDAFAKQELDINNPVHYGFIQEVVEAEEKREHHFATDIVIDSTQNHFDRMSIAEGSLKDHQYGPVRQGYYVAGSDGDLVRIAQNYLKGHISPMADRYYRNRSSTRQVAKNGVANVLKEYENGLRAVLAKREAERGVVHFMADLIKYGVDPLQADRIGHLVTEIRALESSPQWQEQISAEGRKYQQMAEDNKAVMESTDGLHTLYEYEENHYVLKEIAQNFADYLDSIKRAGEEYRRQVSVRLSARDIFDQYLELLKQHKPIHDRMFAGSSKAAPVEYAVKTLFNASVYSLNNIRFQLVLAIIHEEAQTIDTSDPEWVRSRVNQFMDLHRDDLVTDQERHLIDKTVGKVVEVIQTGKLIPPGVGARVARTVDFNSDGDESTAEVKEIERIINDALRDLAVIDFESEMAQAREQRFNYFQVTLEEAQGGYYQNVSEQKKEILSGIVYDGLSDGIQMDGNGKRYLDLYIYVNPEEASVQELLVTIQSIIATNHRIERIKDYEPWMALKTSLAPRFKPSGARVASEGARIAKGGETKHELITELKSSSQVLTPETSAFFSEVIRAKGVEALKKAVRLALDNRVYRLEPIQGGRYVVSVEALGVSVVIDPVQVITDLKDKSREAAQSARSVLSDLVLEFKQFRSKMIDFLKNPQTNIVKPVVFFVDIDYLGDLTEQPDIFNSAVFILGENLSKLKGVQFTFFGDPSIIQKAQPNLKGNASYLADTQGIDFTQVTPIQVNASSVIKNANLNLANTQLFQAFVEPLVIENRQVTLSDFNATFGLLAKTTRTAKLNANAQIDPRSIPPSYVRAWQILAKDNTLTDADIAESLLGGLNRITLKPLSRVYIEAALKAIQMIRQYVSTSV